MSSATPIVDRIGPYRVVRALGSSGAASFVAREEGPIGFTREVVLKLVANPTPEDGRIVKELAREATICSKLNHPNIIRTHDFFEHDNQLVLVLEHVDGVSLAELMSSLRENGRRLSDDAVFYIGVAILEALAHAHAHLDDEGERAPIVHRSVSPSTVSLGKDGAVKLGGFALAKVLSEEPDTIVGPRDASYMAPEQRISEKVDVYAAGLLLWELLTGRPPPENVEPLSSVRRDLPRELLAAVDAALEHNSEKRTIGCADMASWIKKVTHTSRGKKEVRERVTELAVSNDSSHEPTPATAESSGRIPLVGWTAWTAKLPPVLAAGPRWLDRLPRRQRRAVWVGAIGSLVLFLLLAMGRPPAPAAAIAGSVPSALPARPDPVAAPAALAATTPAPTAIAPAALNAQQVLAVPPGMSPAPLDPASSPPPAATLPVTAGDYNKTKFGFLTIHSTVPQGFVYVHLIRYGKVEDRLIVPCGKRFVSIGIPNFQKREPTWLAPSQFINVPCGGSVEATILPRKLR
jgi:eukaryotic-like serine/threonine-protein kinase